MFSILYSSKALELSAVAYYVKYLCSEYFFFKFAKKIFFIEICFCVGSHQICILSIEIWTNIIIYLKNS